MSSNGKREQRKKQLDSRATNIERVLKGIKWELGFAYFLLGKWDFMHLDWDS
jgi:hypothetical protein